MSRRKTIMMLPDDLLLNCLARVSRLYHPTLSLASNRFRSLLASAELYQTRTLLGCTESCLYVALFYTNSSPLRWFTLSRIPNSSQRFLVPVSSPNSTSASYTAGLNSGWSVSSSHCVIDNVVYQYFDRTIRWYDSEEGLWKTLKGLECLPKPNLSLYIQVTLVDLGGKLLVLWEELASLDNHMGKRIWCAEIAIGRKLQTGDIWGQVEWFDVVSPIHQGCSLVHALACTI